MVASDALLYDGTVLHAQHEILFLLTIFGKGDLGCWQLTHVAVDGARMNPSGKARVRVTPERLCLLPQRKRDCLL